MHALARDAEEVHDLATDRFGRRDDSRRVARAGEQRGGDSAKKIWLHTHQTGGGEDLTPGNDLCHGADSMSAACTGCGEPILGEPRRILTTFKQMFYTVV